MDNLYHFKVMTLRVHQDTERKGGLGGAECKLYYHFFHKLLAPYEDKDDCDAYDWYLRDGNIMQRLYIHKSRSMLEVI